MSLTKTPLSMIETTGVATGQVLTYNGSTSTWVASAAPATQSSLFAAKAWVNFDATRNAAGTVDSSNTARYLRSSYNVTSVVRYGLGNYTVNFTTAMNNTEYCAVGSAGNAVGGGIVCPNYNVVPTTTSMDATIINTAGTGVDVKYNMIVVFAS